MRSSDKERLLIRECAAVFVMLVIIVTITISSFVAKSDRRAKVQTQISVQVMGAVAQQQQLLLPMGAAVVDALARITLTDNADLGKLSLDEKLQPDQVLIIPTKGKISIFVTGAVTKNAVILIPEECRYSDLKSYINLCEDADLKVFKRRRRLLREGETVHIPAL